MGYSNFNDFASAKAASRDPHCIMQPHQPPARQCDPNVRSGHFMINRDLHGLALSYCDRVDFAVEIAALKHGVTGF